MGLSLLCALLPTWVVLQVLPHPLSDLFSVWLAFTLLATRSLHHETSRVVASLREGKLDLARSQLSWLVSRDTGHLDREGVMRATLETLSENISDGVIAPLFYLALGGPLLALLYKTVNTLDSMVGYKNDRYLSFGKAAARLDDLLNYLPARLSGLLIVVGAAVLRGAAPMVGSASLRRLDCRRGLQIMRRDGRCLSSPNAGIPQAAMAGVLGVSLGGPTSYFGTLVDKPTMGDPLYPPDDTLYRCAVTILYTTSLTCALLAMVWRRYF